MALFSQIGENWPIRVGMDLLGSVQPGLQQAQVQFDKAARGVTEASLPTKAPDDSVSLSDAAVSLLGAKNQYETELSVTHVAGQMDRTTLNLLG
jgi:hypothetical protein